MSLQAVLSELYLASTAGGGRVRQPVMAVPGIENYISQTQIYIATQSLIHYTVLA